MDARITEPTLSWPRLVCDLKGLRVRILQPLSNAYLTVPAGTVGTIQHATGWQRIVFVGPPCSCCGVAPRVTNVSRTMLSLVPPETATTTGAD